MSTKIIPARQSQIDALAEAFHRETLDSAQLAAEAYLTLVPLDLVDLLKRELETAPNSPVSVEIRRRMRILADERAQIVANDILLGD